MTLFIFRLKNNRYNNSIFDSYPFQLSPCTTNNIDMIEQK